MKAKAREPRWRERAALQGREKDRMRNLPRAAGPARSEAERAKELKEYAVPIPPFAL
jgi:hypothetical protein